jgi:hypothetical protein
MSNILFSLCLLDLHDSAGAVYPIVESYDGGIKLTVSGMTIWLLFIAHTAATVDSVTFAPYPL